MQHRSLSLGLETEALSSEQWRQVSVLAKQLRLSLKHFATAAERDAADLSDAEIIIGSFPPKALLKAHKLKWLQQISSGIDWLLDQPELRNRAFVLTNGSDANCVPLAEHAMMGWLAWARHFPQAMEAQHKREWSPPPRKEEVFEIANSTLLIAGMGSIGKHLASIAKGFGARTLALRNRPGGKHKPDAIDEVYPSSNLLQILPEADAIVNTLPYTPDTHHLFDRKAFESMKPSAIFINVGRGKTVNETDLAEALNSKQIYAACLDVFQQEPLPPESLLRSCRNLLITSHYAWYTPHFKTRIAELIVDNLSRYANGRELRNVVDKHKCY
ncbi:MAG: D-2-hydroxyacid dehydrogenase [Opitutales bacterium]|nr:D-2-hydroxyacid dehydrogenase [Opitutales bacterium]